MVGCKSQRGVTLIELLIVIVIMGSVLSLVGPYTFKQLDKFKAENEKSVLLSTIRQQRFKAFQQQRSTQLLFEGKQLHIIPDKALTHELLQLRFEHLAFEQQSININQNGFLSQTQLFAYSGGRKIQFDMWSSMDGERLTDETSSRIYLD